MYRHGNAGIWRRIGKGLQVALPIFVMITPACRAGSTDAAASKAPRLGNIEVIGNSATDIWHCTEDGSTLIIDPYKRTVEMIVPQISCDVLIVDGARGTFSGRCSLVSPLLQYQQFVKVKDDDSRVSWGYNAYSFGVYVQKGSAVFILDRTGSGQASMGDGETSTFHCHH
jgi:hypothetical protein